MTTFTNAEFEILEDAFNGDLLLGTPEFDSALATLQNNPNFFDTDDYVEFLNVIQNNASHPEAAFYDMTALIGRMNGADSNTIAWLNGAAGVNRGDSAASDFIRDYTAAQVEARTGQTVDQIALQAASNAIAASVFADIADDFTLPTLNRIGEHDALTAMSTLKSFGFPDDPAIWSGNLLFSGLGDNSFLNTNLLGNASDTYDFFVAGYALQEAGFGSALNAATESFWTLFWNQGSGYSAIEAMNNFMFNAYESLSPSGPGVLGAETIQVDLDGNFAKTFYSGGSLANLISPSNDLVHMNAGDDTFIGGAGNDFVDGGSGFDTVSMFSYTEQADERIVLTLEGQSTSSVPYSGTIELGTALLPQFYTYLFDIESVELGLGDDILEFTDFTNVETVDARENGDEGDTIDLSLATASINVDFDAGTLSSGDGDNVMAVQNFENVIGSAFDDTITGDDQANWIDGGADADIIDGGEGQDVLHFAKDGDAVTVNFQTVTGVGTGAEGDAEGDTYSNIEVVIGTDSADNFKAWDGSGKLFAGGGGEDTFEVIPDYENEVDYGDAPVFLWGGEGNEKDTFNLDRDVKMLVITIADITEENFASLSVDDLGLDIDWSLIDVVLINPDANDVINLARYSEDSISLSQLQVNIGTVDDPLYSSSYIARDYKIATPRSTPADSPFVWSETASVFGGVFEIQGVWPTDDGVPWPEFGPDSQYLMYNDPLGDLYSTGWLMLGAEMVGSTITVAAGENFLISLGTNSDDMQIGSAAAETFSGSAGSDNMDGGTGIDLANYGGSAASVNVNLASGTGLGGDADGDTYVNIENVSGSAFDDNLTGDSNSNALTGNAGDDTLDGQGGDDLLNGGLGDDTIIGGAGDDTIVYLGGDDTILGNAANKGNDTLDLSQYNADQVSFTNVGNDMIITTPDGTITLQDQVLRGVGHWLSNIENIIFADGTLDDVGIRERAIADQNTSGDDVISAGAGDDTIVYLGGDDTIVGNLLNHGDDTLDLSQYNADQVTFVNDGNDVVITTPDGTIRLDAQITRDLGHYHSNIENLIFADGTLDEAGIRARAVADQSTTGDDAIVATKFDDVISYDGGNDSIAGRFSNYGNDTLDLSQYNADQVTFLNVGNDIVITTPDGSITLDQQIRWDVGHGQSNIENLIFADGTLDEAGIRARAVADQSTTGDDAIVATKFDDVISYDGGNDSIAGRFSNYGNDTLDLSQYNADQVSFLNVGNDIVITTPDGSITLDQQIRWDVGHGQSNIESLIFADGTLDEAGIRARAVADQSTTGDDAIVATKFDDVISYDGGNDTIAGRFSNYGNDTLDLSQYNADQVSFLNVGNDIVITTPDGSITLDQQIRNVVGHGQSNIENLIFADGTLDEAGIRARAVADQSTVGDDAIVATKFDDVIDAGIGNDIITMGSGSDIIEFDFGDGNDTVTDFQDGVDLIDLSVTGLTFGDLTISDSAEGVQISFDDGDPLTPLDNLLLTGLTASLIAADDFIFS